MTYREFDIETDYYSFLKLLDEMLVEVHQDDLNRIIDTEKISFNGVEGKFCQYIEDQCKIRVAESEQGTIVGFLVYHLIFDCIMIVRGVHFDKAYRKKGYMYGIFKHFIKSGLKKVYSQTFANNEPKEIIGEKKDSRFVSRKLIATIDGMNIWENTFKDRKWQ